MRRTIIGGVLVIAIFLIFTPVTGLAISGICNDISCLDYEASWTDMSPVTAPPSRADSSLVYDSESDVVILFGGVLGAGRGKLNDTWAYSYELNTWVNKSPAAAPDIRSARMMAYDSESDRVILFGGFIRLDELPTGHVCYNDTWSYDYNTNTWTNLEPATAPTARTYGAMAYDEQSDRIILFGGILEGTSVAADTWAYDYNTNTWEEMSPASHPSPRFQATMAYNSAADRMILYGGVNPAVLQDTWAYHYESDTWTNLNPSEHPTEAPGQMTYDSEDDLCILFGGSYDFEETSMSSATWGYDYSSNSWTSFAVNSHPEGRCRAILTYDSDSDVVILFGGMGVGRYDNLFNDTWVNSMDPVTTATTTTTTTTTTTILVIDPLWIVAGVGAVVIVLVAVVYLKKMR